MKKLVTIFIIIAIVSSSISVFAYDYSSSNGIDIDHTFTSFSSDIGLKFFYLTISSEEFFGMTYSTENCQVYERHAIASQTYFSYADKRKR